MSLGYLRSRSAVESSSCNCRESLVLAKTQRSSARYRTNSSRGFDWLNLLASFPGQQLSVFIQNYQQWLISICREDNGVDHFDVVPGSNPQHLGAANAGELVETLLNLGFAHTGANCIG